MSRRTAIVTAIVILVVGLFVLTAVLASCGGGAPTKMG
jgi:hypothetical protein